MSKEEKTIHLPKHVLVLHNLSARLYYVLKIFLDMNFYPRICFMCINYHQLVENNLNLSLKKVIKVLHVKPRFPDVTISGLSQYK